MVATWLSWSVDEVTNEKLEAKHVLFVFQRWRRPQLRIQQRQQHRDEHKHTHSLTPRHTFDARKICSRFLTTIHPNDIFKLCNTVCSDTCHCGRLCKNLRVLCARHIEWLLCWYARRPLTIPFSSDQFSLFSGMNRVILYAVNYVNRERFSYFGHWFVLFGKSKGIFSLNWTKLEVDIQIQKAAYYQLTSCWSLD